MNCFSDLMGISNFLKNVKRGGIITVLCLTFVEEFMNGR